MLWVHQELWIRFLVRSAYATSDMHQSFFLPTHIHMHQLRSVARRTGRTSIVVCFFLANCLHERVCGRGCPCVNAEIDPSLSHRHTNKHVRTCTQMYTCNHIVCSRKWNVTFWADWPILWFHYHTGETDNRPTYWYSIVDRECGNMTPNINLSFREYIKVTETWSLSLRPYSLDRAL